MRSWNPNYRNVKAETCSREAFVKDDSGANAVLFEQGSSACQMTAAKVMDVIAGLPDCDGQAAAVSAYTLVKMEDAPTSLKIPKSECPDFWIRLPKKKTNGPKSWFRRKTHSFFLSEICMAILWQDYYGKYFYRSTKWPKSWCSMEDPVVIS